MTEPVRKKTGQAGKPSLDREGLRAQKICKTYGTQENPVYALKETSFQIPKGAVRGQSWDLPGAGKSTLLHVLGGIEEPDGGSVWIKGKGSVPDGAEQTGGLSQAQHWDGVPVHFPSSRAEH